MSLKLNLGCGFNHQNGWINVDREAACHPDVFYDLEQFPWPWDTDSVDRVQFRHSLEHLGETTAQFKQIMQELYRICKPGAQVFVYAPWPFHLTFVSDPTHVRVLTPTLFDTMSSEVNAEWREKGWAGTPLSLYWNIDFKRIKTDVFVEEFSREPVEFLAILEVKKP